MPQTRDFSCCVYVNLLGAAPTKGDIKSNLNFRIHRARTRFVALYGLYFESSIVNFE